MMSIRRSSIALFVLVVALTVSAFAQSSTKVKAKGGDPIVQDRPLSAWIADLGGDAPYTRVSAAYAVGSAGPAAKAAVPALIENLSSENASVRYSSTLALGEIGPDAATAVPALQKELDDRNDDVAHMAKKSIKLITREASE